MFKQLVQQQGFFLWPMLVLSTVAGIFLAMEDKGFLVLALNTEFPEALLYVASWITRIAEVYVIIAIGVLLFILSVRYGLLYVLSFSISSIFAQFFKKVVFAGLPRPVQFFSGVEQLVIIDGMELHRWNSFPSGHATAAFAMFFSLCLFVKSPVLKFVFFMIAAAVAISRVVLAQHFLEDIVAGACLGTILSLLIYYLLENKEVFNRWNVPRKGMLELIRK